MDQHYVAVMRIGDYESMPGRRPGEHQPGGLWPVQRGRLRDQRLRPHDKLGRIGAWRAIRDHLIACGDLPSRAHRAGSHRCHHASGLRPETDRQLSGIGAERPAVDLVVDRVDTRRPDLDARLTRSGFPGRLIDD